ncbi:ribosome recycling factor [Criblamydia sequanensis]|uniref:Ribosome-recycling factor n=1 Tax=Candidatus Criblamydia sequanensis CRIB-18 TaxID=1437425 RepID=A0A090D230_9BACT|nr:ribosome recycling factor [Criblamydia sequanensis]CDR34255.1 Ribosome recycling factor [Criblamydia sequanensis CRIB-18]
MRIKEQTEEGMKAALNHLAQELKNIRTGRANPGILDSVSVEVYGSPMRLRDLANITVPESRQLLIIPFDKKNCASIGKAIEKANLGLRPIVEGDVVRINIPPMDENIRKDMVKLCHKRREEAKVGIRNVRAHNNKIVRDEKAQGNIGEDIVKKEEKEIQTLTDKYCKLADDMVAQKEKEILTI